MWIPIPASPRPLYRVSPLPALVALSIIYSLYRLYIDNCPRPVESIPPLGSFWPQSPRAHAGRCRRTCRHGSRTVGRPRRVKEAPRIAVAGMGPLTWDNHNCHNHMTPRIHLLRRSSTERTSITCERCRFRVEDPSSAHGTFPAVAAGQGSTEDRQGKAGATWTNIGFLIVRIRSP